MNIETCPVCKVQIQDGAKVLFSAGPVEPAPVSMPAFVAMPRIPKVALIRAIMKLAQKTVTTDPIADAREAFLAVRQYQRDWQRHGVDRVRLYYDDVDGNWLDEFDKD
jgi:hypothetical protein